MYKPALWITGPHTPAVWIIGMYKPALWITSPHIPAVWITGTHTPAVWITGTHTPAVWITGLYKSALWDLPFESIYVTIFKCPEYEISKRFRGRNMSHDATTLLVLWQIVTKQRNRIAGTAVQVLTNPLYYLHTLTSDHFFLRIYETTSWMNTGSECPRVHPAILHPFLWVCKQVYTN